MKKRTNVLRVKPVSKEEKAVAEGFLRNAGKFAANLKKKV